MAPKTKSVALYACLGGLFLIAASDRARTTWDTLRALLPGARLVEAPFGIALGGDVVRAVSPQAREAGVSVGDRVSAIAGRTYTGRAVLGRALNDSKPGDTLAVDVLRAGSTAPRRIEIPLASLGKENLALILILGFFTPLLCLALGFGVTALRPQDPRAWSLLLLLLGFSQLFGARLIEAWQWPDGLRPPGLLWGRLMASAWSIGMLLFAIHFPDRLALDRRKPWLKWLLLLPLVLVASARAALELLDSESIASGAGLLQVLRWLGPAPEIAQMLAVGCLFASLGFRMGTAPSPDARRRLALLLWGAALGLTPSWLLLLTALATGRSLGAMPVPLLVPALLLVPLFPITLAYVIVVQRAMDVRVVIRQGLQYAFARRGIRVLQVVASGLVALALLTLATDPGANRPQRLTFVALGVAFVFAARAIAERPLAWVDRRFFRETVNSEQVLSGLSEEVRSIVETDKLLSTVAQRIADALHIPRLATLLKNRGAYRVAHQLGFGAGVDAGFAEGGPTVAHLLRTRDAARVYLDDSNSWANREPGMDTDRAALLSLQSQLLLPLALKGELIGFLSLGPKQSEEPYSPSDVRLLRSVATQTALALENSRLTAAVAAEVARAARLNREIEIAHEVQEQLFPQSYPKTPGVELAGHCRPAAGVGGDYYDFLDLKGGGLGIAIGDVSGKGIPAALLMAGLQASLRGQTLAGPANLAALMDNINRLIVEASPANRYATFFYGQYDPATRQLTYVNAGHNAPMVFRGRDANRQVLRLSDGGPVVGLFYAAAYQQGGLRLEAGDLLVGFTDGISECMSPDDEEWGEERMMQAIHSCDGLPAAVTIDQLMKSADAFAAGAKQHDDMTLLVMRVL